MVGWSLILAGVMVLGYAVAKDGFWKVAFQVAGLTIVVWSLYRIRKTRHLWRSEK